MSIVAFMLWKGRVMMWTQRFFLRSFQGVLGEVLILYRIAVLDLLFRVVYFKGRPVLPLSTRAGVNFGVHSSAIVWSKKTLS